MMTGTPAHDVEIGSVSEFLEAVETLVSRPKAQEAPGNRFELWYRGHSDASWLLEPTLLRPPYDKNAYTFGKTFYYQFKARAQPHLERPPVTDLDWMMIAQHHGVPTRLLDWTESAATALYFAVRAPRSERAACVWMLDPNWLGQKIFDRPMVLTGEHERAQNYANPLCTESAAPPVPLFPDRIASRMVNQHSCFTLHPWTPRALETIAAKEPATSGLQRVLIADGAKRRIATELRRMGVTEATVFPDLDGLSRDLRQTFAGDDTKRF